MKKLTNKIKAATLAAVCLVSAAALPMTNASAKQVLVGYKGDLNHDMEVTIADAVMLSKHLLNAEPLSADSSINADMDNDSIVDVFDLIMLRKYLTGELELAGIYNEEPDDPDEYDFISPSIKEVKASLPSQGDANLVIFYVDFPDCTYANKLTTEQVQKIAFGDANSGDANYPFDSMSAFYSRSSKGSMNLSGQVFSYTTKNPMSSYGSDKLALAKECYEAFKDSDDFTRFDGNGDGKIDATLFTVPEQADSDYWWPCAGGFGDSKYTVDGMYIGHIITGNAAPVSTTDYSNFNSSYLHEMGHCMGLPDYYLYSSDDYEGMHGAAGIELMDADACTDFCTFSKLMLGWYREDQISVYDSSAATQTFELSNAQTDDGNCVIVPYGELNGQYFSEYFIIEYATEDNNNSGIKRYWWMPSGSGIRIYHINAELHQDYWFPHLKYQNGSVFTNGDDDGIRLIRLVNDVEGDNYFKTGDVIDNSVSGFGWYDANENESIDPGVTINVGALADGKYTITISNK